MNYAVEQRLRLIDFLLAHYGHVGRVELVTFFGISEPTSTRDFKLYLDKAPGNAVYDIGARRYLKSLGFKPLFNHDSPEVSQ